MARFQGYLEYTYKDVTYVFGYDYGMWLVYDKESGGEDCSNWPSHQFSLEEVMEELRIIQDGD